MEGLLEINSGRKTKMCDLVHIRNPDGMAMFADNLTPGWGGISGWALRPQPPAAAGNTVTKEHADLNVHSRL